MALIKCPECKKKISDKCENCPQCGYPINKICETDESQSADFGNVGETIKTKKSFDIKSLMKKWWFCVAIGVVIAAITTTTILLLNRDTKPKFDKEGNPVFVELTNEVYTNAKTYTGYHINIKGKVFQVMSDNGKVKGIQIWLDPDTCEQNMMIYYNTDVEVKQGDYIICSGYIDSVTEYKNAYDAKLYAPLVISSDLRKSTYMEVMAPANETITPENLKQEKYGYSVTIDKIEFAEKETRVYATVKNNGKALLYFGDAVIVQDGKQYNSTDNYDSDYEEIPYEIVKGVSCSGIMVFPTISTNNFELTIDIHSENDDEKLGEIVATIGKEKSEIKIAWPIDEVKPVVTPTPAPEKLAFVGHLCTDTNSAGMPANDKTIFHSYEFVTIAGKLTGVTGKNNITLRWVFPNGHITDEKIYELKNGETTSQGMRDIGIGDGSVTVIFDKPGETLGYFPFTIVD